jgi:hypothetical protein
MDDTIPTRLAYDATQRFVSVGPHTLQATQYRYFHDGSIRYDDDTACCIDCRSFINISLQKAEEISRNFKIPRCSALS